jgi:hypothetical protein
LLLLEGIEECVRRIGRGIHATPSPRRLQIGDARESRERAVER